MTMHLHHPSLSLMGKKKGKVKFKSAEAKREHERLDREWQELLKRQGAELEAKRQRRAMKAEPLTYNLGAPSGRFTSTHIPSRNTGDGIASVKQIPKYTGTKIIGISQMAKSNAVPVFEQEHIIDISRMRR